VQGDHGAAGGREWAAVRRARRRRAGGHEQEAEDHRAGEGDGGAKDAVVDADDCSSSASALSERLESSSAAPKLNRASLARLNRGASTSMGDLRAGAEGAPEGAWDPRG
jgi:hypothetical protein